MYTCHTTNYTWNKLHEKVQFPELDTYRPTLTTTWTLPNVFSPSFAVDNHGIRWGSWRVLPMP